MSTHARPGQYVEETLTQTTTPVNPTVAIAAFVAPAVRGPVQPVTYTSWSEIQKDFGNFTGDPAKDVLLQAALDNLNNGGRTVALSRAVGAGAVASSLVFKAERGGTNEVQTVTVSGTPTGGAFKLSYGGQDTADIAYNAAASAVRAALEALSTIGTGNVAVTGSAGGPYSVTFKGSLAGTNVSPLTSSNTLTGGTSPSVAVVEATPGVGGVDALTLSAPNPGLWGDQLYVEVQQIGTSDRFNLVIRLVPTGAAITNQQVVDRYSDLSLDPQDNRYVVGVLGGPRGSAFIDVELAPDFVYTSGDYLRPSTIGGGSKLAGGADGSTVGNDELLDAVYALDVISQPFVLNVPGVVDSAVITALADYADASRLREDDGEPGRGDVFVVVDTAPGLDVQGAIDAASAYPESDCLAVYYPCLVVSDPAAVSTGATKLVPPGPAVVGRYMSTDAAKGVFKSPAGDQDGLLTGVLSLDPAALLRNPQLDALNLANVNAIKVLPGRGPAVYGARTRKRDRITRYVSARRTLISARADLLAATTFGPFENNDAFLWGDLYNAADRVLRELFTAGGLKGSTPEQAYYVKCDSDNNTPGTIEAGEVHLEVGLAVQRPAEFVVIRIGQYDGGVTANATES